MQIFFFKFYTSNIVSKFFPLLCGYKCKAFINALDQQKLFLSHYHPFLTNERSDCPVCQRWLKGLIWLVIYNQSNFYPYEEKLTIGEKWLSQLEVFLNIVVLPIARERGNSPLPDNINIKIHQIDNC